MADREARTTGVHIEGMDTLVRSVIQRIEARGLTPELPTGIDGLDAATWGLHRAEVTVIAGRPGEGKTALALQICSNLARLGKRVAFVSLEMTREQLVERWLVQLTQTDAWSLRTGKDVAAFKEKLAQYNGFFEVVNFRCVDGCGYTIGELQHLLNKFVSEGGGAPDILVLDFIQLISPEGGLQKFDAIAEYIRAVKEMAMRHEMAVILCSQVNREGGRDAAKNPPRLIHLKGSGAIEELADCVISLWWQEIGTEEKPEGIKYWLSIEKQRHGSPGQRIQVRFNPSTLTFHSVNEPVEEWKAGDVREPGVDV